MRPENFEPDVYRLIEIIQESIGYQTFSLLMNLKYTEISSLIDDKFCTALVKFSNDEWTFNLSHSNSFGVYKLVANINLKNQGSFDFINYDVNYKGNQEVLARWLDLFKNQCQDNGLYISREYKETEDRERRVISQDFLIPKNLHNTRSFLRADSSTFHDPLQLERMYIDPSSLGETPFQTPFPDEHDFNRCGVFLQKNGDYYKDYEIALACFLVALKKNPSFEPALINKKIILEILGWEDGDVFELFKKNILSKLETETIKILETLSETFQLGIQLEKDMELLDDSTFNRKISIILKENIVVGLGIFNCTEVIPDNIGNLTTLQSLYLYGGRRFSLKYIPESIKKLTALKKLSIHKLKEEYFPEWLETFEKKMREKMDLTIDIEESPIKGKKLERKDYFQEKRKAEEQRIIDEKEEKERLARLKKDLEERRIKQNEIELKNEEELTQNLADAEKLIVEEDFQGSEDILVNIIHKANRYHLIIFHTN